MVRQYIGARYITKIYENSQDPYSAEWEAGVNYEPLTMVTYNNGSYLSKKDVPASVGDPASNPAYWVQTGFYNGQIAALENRVGDLETEAIEIPKKDYISLGDIEFTRYHFTGFICDVIKIPHDKTSGGYNKPIINATATASNMAELSKNTKAAANMGYWDYNTHETVGAILVNDVVIPADQALTNDYNYVAIDDDGKFAYFPYSIDLTTLPSLGYHYACPMRCPVIENGAISPDVNLTRFMQQIIGYDDDMNYYIITTSYHSTWDLAAQVAWILSIVPTMKSAFAADSGGSTQTTIGGVKTSLECDIENKGLGREIHSAIVFPADNIDSDSVTALAAVALAQNNIQPRILVNIGTTEEVTGANLSLYQTHIYRVGNLVIGHIMLIVKDGYDGNWTNLTVLEDNLPKPDTALYCPAISNYSIAGNGRLTLPYNSDQTTIKPSIQFKAPANSTGTDLYYDIPISYVTKQNT